MLMCYWYEECVTGKYIQGLFKQLKVILGEYNNFELIHNCNSLFATS